MAAQGAGSTVARPQLGAVMRIAREGKGRSVRCELRHANARLGRKRQLAGLARRQPKQRQARAVAQMLAGPALLNDSHTGQADERLGHHRQRNMGLQVYQQGGVRD